VPIKDRFLAASCAVFWGLNFLTIDLGLHQFPPLLFVALRFGIIAIPTVLLIPRPKVRLRWLLGYGLGFGFMQFGLLFIAMRIGMPAGLASLVLQASAPFTVLLGVLLLRERMRPIQVAGICLAVTGMSGIVWHRAEVAAVLPVLLTLLGALGWAIGNLCSRRGLSEAAAAGERVTPWHLTLWMTVVAPLPMLALSLAVEGPAADWHALSTIGTATGLAALGGLLYIVVFATVIASGVWTTLLNRHPAGVVAPFSLLVPVVGISSAWLLLGEQPALIELVSAAVVVTGVLLGIPRTTQSPPVSPRTSRPSARSAGSSSASR
jgi:O-acetylserine/cysteine efflux transporter